MTKTAQTTTAVKSTPVAKPGSTADSGAVKVGAGSIRFASTRDSGKVHVGAGSMRF